MSLSFFDFSRLSPRERMLRGLGGQLSPTFGLEVGAPRAQLGIIPLAGLGLWRPPSDSQGFNPGQTNIAPSDAALLAARNVIGGRPSSLNVTTYTTPNSSMPMVTLPSAKAAPSPAMPANAAPQSSPSDPYIMQAATPDPHPDATVHDPVAEDETTYAKDTEYDSDGNKQDAWGEGGSGDGAAVYDHDTYANETGAIKKTATSTEAAMQAAAGTAAKYAPWILGGLGLAAAAYFIGRRK